MPRKLCPKCHGQRTIACLACHGTGKKIPVGNCEECGGTGRRICDVCSGTVEIEHQSLTGDDARTGSGLCACAASGHAASCGMRTPRGLRIWRPISHFRNKQGCCFLTAAAPCTACIGDGLLPHSGNDLTLVFELRLIDLAAGEALG